MPIPVLKLPSILYEVKQANICASLQRNSSGNRIC